MEYAVSQGSIAAGLLSVLGRPSHRHHHLYYRGLWRVWAPVFQYAQPSFVSNFFVFL